MGVYVNIAGSFLFLFIREESWALQFPHQYPSSPLFGFFFFLELCREGFLLLRVICPEEKTRGGGKFLFTWSNHVDRVFLHLRWYFGFGVCFPFVPWRMNSWPFDLLALFFSVFDINCIKALSFLLVWDHRCSVRDEKKGHAMFRLGV